MKIKIRSVALCCVILPYLFGVCIAKPVLTGKVSDIVGAPVPGVELTLISQKRVYATAVSDDGGNYSFPSLRIGLNEIRAVCPGFLTTTLEFKYDPRISIEWNIEVLMKIDPVYIALEGLWDDFSKDANQSTAALQVINSDGSPAANVEVLSTKGASLGHTDANGIILLPKFVQEGSPVFRFRKSERVYQLKAEGGTDLLFTVKLPVNR